ncbi:Predicted dehydrogenase [Pelagirhabdus alkalitolerans]|uniref:Predicted dehydrogenase n=1 Tax=Pelagirhabdus alkalitolerans TaxID=1612202 RepID=A0A1G6KZE7_9BACI|nr:Gfo/Idh/MocA family oxidoreductase [Pelagirhabdus alkalitolerans]SDC36450.1 Predicted dehydrogenase [Pelagirhabdus alkalitolerans]
MQDVVKWGILSTAGIAQFELIPAFKRAENAEVVAISSLSGRAHEVSEQLNIKKAYDSYMDILQDDEIDAVYIPLPNHLHRDWVIKAAQHGKHVLCEKPASLTADDVNEMKEACHRHNVIFMEAFMYYLHPQHQRVKELIQSGEIGQVKQFKSHFSFLLEDREQNIRMDASLGGGSLYDLGCYTIHAMRNILGEEPNTVRTEAIIDSSHQVDTTAVSHFEFNQDVTAVVESSFDMAGFDQYEVIGTKGRITVPRAFRPDTRGEGKVILEKDNQTQVETFINDLYRDEIEHISLSILTNQEPIITFDDTYHNMRTIDACLRSVQSGNRETI